MLSSSGSHLCLIEHESRVALLSPRAWAAIWSLQRPSLSPPGWCCPKTIRESSCGPLEEWCSRPRTDDKFTSVRKTLGTQKVVTAKSCLLGALGVHRARHAAAAIQQRSTNCTFTNQRRRCTETELPPTRPLQQLAADARRRVPTRAPDAVAAAARAHRQQPWRARVVMLSN